jgi:hypothetical protein
MMFDIDEFSAPRKARQRSKWDRSSLCGAVDWKNADFRCVHCRAYVTAQFLFAGVHNRNHCPYCLWSRHLDLHEAGDRLSACKGSMQPVGLTLKKQRKKYTNGGQGELMLVHRCSECSRVSINRIAADDDPGLMLEIYERSLSLAPGVDWQIQTQGIECLTEAEREIVLARLFGW